MSGDPSSDRSVEPSRDQDRVRALLRLKRMERPPEAFWSGFERDLQRELFRSARRRWTPGMAWVLAPVMALACTLVVTTFWRQSETLPGNAGVPASVVAVEEHEASFSWVDEEWSGTRFVANAWAPREDERVYAVSNVLGETGQVRDAAAETVFYVSDRWSRDERRSAALTLNR